MGEVILKQLFLSLISTIVLTGCVSNNHINYFPDQRGPLYCHLGDTPSAQAYRSTDYEVVPIENWPQAFVLRKSSTNEFVVLANSLLIKSAQAKAVYESSWWRQKLVAIKILVMVGIENQKEIVDRVKGELATKYPGAVITEPVPADILVDLYSIWLGSEYIRAPCDGVALDNVPFEITLPPEDGAAFLRAKDDQLQLAGRIIFRDAISGWRFHRSFSLNRGDFELTH
jgi:hypothetical protein